MDVDQRNELAKQFIKDKLELVSSFTESSFENLNDYKRLKDILQNLIHVKAMGFRGVVATALTGKHLDPEYDPLNNFYSCNPRSIFEHGIFYAFEEKRIPCGKSDPLNVAKNINVLNNEWAKGKRPQKAAQAAVDYLNYLETTTDQEQTINFFFFKLFKYAESIDAIEIKLPKEQEWPNQVFASKLSQFFLEYPESGTMPQLIISKLLNKVYENSNIVVCGGDESVFGTNTTSKKPADIWLETNGTPFNLFEITVKKIDAKRLDDCIQSLNASNASDLPVHFICRLPVDVDTLKNIEDFTLHHNGKTFNFWDIKSFTHSLSSLLSGDQINKILSDVQNFVKQIDRPVKTKEGWKKIFS
jgi:hypothetical protein